MKVLVAPLSWGIGHATRCIPLVRFLIGRGDEVHIASDGAALAILRAHFPELKYHTLPSLSIKYTYKLPLYFAFPRIAIQLALHFLKDRKAIAKLMKQEHFDCIFSDNRYGIRSKEAKSYIITHQLRICFNQGWRLMEHVSSLIVKKLVKPFNACLVPDYDSSNNLSGLISRPTKGLKMLYIGPQSRFPLHTADIPLPKYDILILLSGPEPQRTLLEQLLVSLSENSEKRIMLVRGTSQESSYPRALNISTLDFASDNMLQSLIKSSQLVIARAGYSTIMDLNALGKGAVLIPTPHQPEQEYLATWLNGKRAFSKAEQNRESLSKYF
jgi:UDP:flavonoid glycosyltransferase YjiC (YdhE family)